MSDILYSVNPDRNVPWNDLPLLPVRDELYRTTEIYEKLGEAKTDRRGSVSDSRFKVQAYVMR